MRNLERNPVHHNEPNRRIGTIRKNARADIAISLRTTRVTGSPTCGNGPAARR